MTAAAASHFRRRRLLMCAIAAGPLALRAAHAADDAPYPNRPIHLVLPSTVGGTSDLLARLIASGLGDALGQPIVLEARSGAAGQIATDRVAAAAPDGYTLLFANNGANAIVPAGRGTSALELRRMFAPVSMLARLPIVICVPPSSGVDTLPDLIAHAQEKPGALSYASGSTGSTSHMAAVLLFQRAGVHLVHVPYAGTSAALKDVLSGEVPVLFTHMATVASLVHAGRLRALAVTGDHRLVDFPDVETVAEFGFPGFDVTTWHGIVAPANTPPPIVMRLHGELVRLVGTAQVRKQLAAMGMEPVGDTPAQFAQALDADVRRWAEVVRAVGTTKE
jgi:tripartite-type tricarboxylate transporter receptor subunit TctC